MGKELPAKEVKKFSLMPIILWIIGLSILIYGLANLSKSVFGGLIIVVAGIFITPFASKWFIEKRNIQLSGPLKIVVVIILLGIGGMLLPPQTPIVINQTSSSLVNNSTTPSLPITNVQGPSIPAEPTLEEIKAEALTVSYDDLFRNNEDYIGKTVYYSMAKIIQVIGTGPEYDFRVEVSPSSSDNSEIIYLDKYTGKRLLEGDPIEIYAKVEGLHTYETVLHSSVTIPKLKVIEMTRLLGDSNAAISNSTAKINTKSVSDNVHLVGEHVEVEGVTYTVDSFSKSDSILFSIIRVNPVGIFAVVNIEAENNGNESKYVSLDFKIVDGKGRKFDSDSTAEAYAQSPFVFGKKLQPDLPVKGQKIFDIPKDATDLKLEIRGNWLTNEKILVTLK